MRQAYDVVVIGSGFSGSVLAWILAQAGRQVLLLDRQVHPRFAIGESSTPVASLLMELMSDEYGLPQLSYLSRWGPWQRSLPEVRGGKKRGFSYFSHSLEKPFTESSQHEASLLVAASASDELSDTQWMRSDVDQWLAFQAESAGVSLLAPAEVTAIRRISAKPRDRWQLSLHLPGPDASQLVEMQAVECDFVVDASGANSCLAAHLGIKHQNDALQVRNSALFGHFRGVGSMHEWLFEKIGSDAETGYPFPCDDAAQHHLLGNCGWMWMLRFDDGTTSVGIVRVGSEQPSFKQYKASKPTAASDRKPDLREMWQRTIKDYPTLHELLHGAELVGPMVGEQVQFGFLPRISRLRKQAAGPGWLMLPGTVGIVDPLHSTGIAHGLSGVYRAARLILDQASDSDYQQYAMAVIDEVRWIDRIVHCCYQALGDSFELFSACCSLYFVAAIHCERELAECGEFKNGFLQEKSLELQKLAAWLSTQLNRLSTTEDRPVFRRQLIAEFRERLEPWNDVGFMEPALRNRIAKSTAPSLAGG